jgi:3-deoxy-manno-octulosonate cytidylyltransferase (CMP-KDO synthetase)
MKIAAVIPAHLASVRFPRKILHPFFGLPMIEHVRRRALLCNEISRVVVATCDDEIAEIIKGYGGDVVKTKSTHKNGTTRVAEALSYIDECSHVVLLQGDEPLLLPRHVNAVVEAIKSNPKGDAWNAVGPLESPDELDKHSFVKCITSINGRILHCFRRSPGYSEFEKQSLYTKKILGIIAYRNDFLINLTSMPETPIESAEFIEQMRILENNFILHSVAVDPSLPSVNELEDATFVKEFIESDAEQILLLNKITGLNLDSF